MPRSTSRERDGRDDGELPLDDRAEAEAAVLVARHAAAGPRRLLAIAGGDAIAAVDEHELHAPHRAAREAHPCGPVAAPADVDADHVRAALAPDHEQRRRAPFDARRHADLDSQPRPPPEAAALALGVGRGRTVVEPRRAPARGWPALTERDAAAIARSGIRAPLRVELPRRAVPGGEEGVERREAEAARREGVAGRLQRVLVPVVRTAGRTAPDLAHDPGVVATTPPQPLAQVAPEDPGAV